jgi:TatD DNase family protein
MTPGFVDTHCHLDNILNRLKLASFGAFKNQFLPDSCEACLTVSCAPDSINPVLTLLEESMVFGAFGIHPHDSQFWSGEIEAHILDAITHPHCVAYGEIGLDYHYTESPVDIQKHNFAHQIDLGLKSGKPLVIHTREAEADTFKILQDRVPHDWPVHVHCFTSSLGFAESLLATFSRLYLGFTGIITFKNVGELEDVAKLTPLNRFLLETDGPYLAPVPHRGQVAHSGHIPLIANRMAALKSVSVDALYAAARQNTRDVYGI